MKGHQCQESKVCRHGGVPLILQNEYKLKLPDKLTVPDHVISNELRHKTMLLCDSQGLFLQSIKELIHEQLCLLSAGVCLQTSKLEGFLNHRTTLITSRAGFPHLL